MSDLPTSPPPLSVRQHLTSLRRRPILFTDLLWVYWGHGFPVSKWNGVQEVPGTILFVDHGGMQYEWEGESVTCRAGDIFFSQAGLRRHRSLPKTKVLSVGYELGWPNGEPLYREGLNRLVAGGTKTKWGQRLYKASLTLFHRVHPRVKELTFAQAVQKDCSTLSAYVTQQAAFAEWLTVLIGVFDELGIKAELPMANLSPVREAKALLDRAPLNRPFSVTQSEKLSVSWRRVEQLFRSELHLTPRQYFEQRRLAQARFRLKQGRSSIKEVASELGFSNLSHFSNWFHSHTGYSPRFFRGSQ